MTNNYFVRQNTLCNILGVTRTTLWRWAKDGKLPPLKRLSHRVTGWWIADLPPEIRDQLKGVA